MTVMVFTAIAVGIFALIANNQNTRATSPYTKTNPEHKRPTTYWLFVFICTAILACVAGLRYYVGTDYGSYYRGYANTAAEFTELIKTWDEPGLSVIAKFLMFFSEDGAVFVFALAAITVFLFVFMLAKHTDDFFFVVMLYIFTSCWSGCFNGARQYLAAAILFAGHRYIFERKFIHYCIVVFLASSFHITALIMLPMYFIITKRLSLQKIVFILVSGIALVYSYDFLFGLVGILKDSETGGADTTYAQNDIHPLRIAIAFAPIVLYLFFALQKKTFSEEENFYMGFIFVRAAIIFGTANSAYLNRVGIYFAPFIPLALEVLINKFDKKQQPLIKAIILILYAILWIYIDASQTEWGWVFNRDGEYTPASDLK
ncbi:MAG: EpsG family protein [Clostridia bacterium]|nr:EpsG family protein [Clostridia bacterium]